MMNQANTLKMQANTLKIQIKYKCINSAEVVKKLCKAGLRALRVKIVLFRTAVFS